MTTIVLDGCRGSFARRPIEEQRVRSPDGRVDAVLLRALTDPLSSDILSVRLEPVGVEPEHQRDMLRAEHTGLGMRWVQDRMLEISYSQGEISAFDNLWWTRRFDPDGETYFVELVLVKRPADSLAAR